MPNYNPKKENLKPFKKGDKRPPNAGTKRGTRHFSTIIKEMLALKPEKLFLLSDEDKDKIAALNALLGGNITVKDMIVQKQISKATKGDQRATELIFRQSGEDAGDKVTVTHDDSDYTKKSRDELIAIASGKGKGGS